MTQPTTRGRHRRNISRYSVGLVCSSSFSPAASCPAFPSSTAPALRWRRPAREISSKRSDPPRLCGHPRNPANSEQHRQDDQRHRHRLRRLVDVMLHLVAHARLAVKRQIHQAEHVERGHQRRDVADAPRECDRRRLPTSRSARGFRPSRRIPRTEECPRWRAWR